MLFIDVISRCAEILNDRCELGLADDTNQVFYQKEVLVLRIDQNINIDRKSWKIRTNLGQASTALKDEVFEIGLQDFKKMQSMDLPLDNALVASLFAFYFEYPFFVKCPRINHGS